MSERVNAFADLTATPVFEVKLKPEKRVAKEAVDRVAESHGFVSRQATKASATGRKPRVYRTGRNRNFSVKATAETVERFYKAADEKGVPLGELLKLGLDAMEAVDSLQRLASEKDISLKELLSEFIGAFGSKAMVP